MPLSTTRVRHETRFRRLTVLRADRITPRMARITFGSSDFEGFASPGFDDHVRLFFPAAGQALPTPQRGERGLIWPDPAPAARDYTPRRFDAATRELAIDFVLHPGGVAADWADAAAPGDRIGMGGPRGSFLVSGTADWHLLMGDATALPAIGRRIEELPEGTRVQAVVEVRDAAEEQSFETAADLSVTWLHAARGETLRGRIRDLKLPEGEGFVFCAAEAATVSAARARLEVLGHPESHAKLSNYWRAGIADDDSH
jgi:NADPH-dependent ferric siderophore reductase